MESLSELVRIITQKRIKRIELFDESSRNKASNYFKLFDGIHSGRYVKDEDASRDLYDCEPTEKKYLILKTRLKQKLMNMLFFVDIERQRDVPLYRKMLFECNRMLYSAKVLYMSNALQSAVPILEKIVKIAQEYSLTQTEMEAVNMLKTYYLRRNQFKEYTLLREQADKVEKQLNAENLSEKYYQELIMTHNRTILNKPLTQKLSEQYYLELDILSKQFHSAKLKMYYYKIKTFHFQITENYNKVVETLSNKEKYLKENLSIFSKRKLEETQLEKLNAYFHLKKNTEAEQYIRESVNMSEGSRNWFTLQEYRYLLAMHNQTYIAAAEIFKKALEQATFRLLPDIKKERWKVFQLYLHYIYKSQKIKEIRGLIQNAKILYKLTDYIKDYPRFSKERRGINLAILEVQLLFHLEKFNTTAMSECVQAMERYCRRYPRQDANYRSECMINMLALMKQENFRFFQTRKASEKYNQELKKTNIEYKGGNKALEILPYEVVWDIVLEKLKTFRYG